jgi:hypothetical protein
LGQAGDSFPRVIRQNVGREALSPMVKGKRSKEKGKKAKAKASQLREKRFPIGLCP